MKRYHGSIAAMGCIVCGGPATVHHVRATIHGRGISKNDELVVPLCPPHHLIQHGPRESVEALGHQGFFITYGIDLLAEATRLWAESAERMAA